MATQAIASDQSHESHLTASELARLPNYKRQGSLVGYTGHFHQRAEEKEGDDVISSPVEKYMIRGYTGFRPTRRSVIGEPRIPNETRQVNIRRAFMAGESSEFGQETKSPPSEAGGQTLKFRSYAKHMSIDQRYQTVIEEIEHLGQSQEELLEKVKGKFEQRALSLSCQQIRIRKLFESFDLNGDGFLDEKEFRFCLELLNVQYDDLQALALFAYFDANRDGFIDWEEFSHHLLVPR